MARTAPDRRRQRGFALVLALFLLAIVSALGLIIGGNGLSARKSARSASYRTAVLERVALATWLTTDVIAQPQKSAHFLFPIEGKEMSVTITPESGRIDLNGLPEGGLSQALQELGYDPTVSQQAAAALSAWRGELQLYPNGLAVRLPDARRAFWSIDDLDAVPGLETGIRDCLKAWGTAHARGTFLGVSPDHPLSLISEIGDSGNVVVGGMIRIDVLDKFSGLKFRSILLYGGGRSLNGSSASPWRVMEWLSPAQEYRCQANNQ